MKAYAWMLALAMLGLALSFAAYRVYRHERNELEHTTRTETLTQRANAPGSTRVSSRLAEVGLHANEEAVFELCSPRPLDATAKLNFDVAILRSSPMELLLRVPLDAEHLKHVRTNLSGSCLLLGRGLIEHDGKYTIDAVWPNRTLSALTLALPLYTRVLARVPLDTTDVISFGLVGLCVVILLIAVFARASQHATEAVEPRVVHDATLDLTRAAIALLCVSGASHLPLYGSTLTVLKGAAMLFVQVGLGAWLIRFSVADGSPWNGLALRIPQVSWLRVTGALALGLCLSRVASAAMQLVPATGEAPVQTFVSWPSGMLAFAVLGLVLPLGEEVFFRGYIYRAALKLGMPTALVVTTLSFTVLHAEQSWGNWGGLLAIFITGTVLTAVRAWSGGLLYSTVAHVSYNAILAVMSLG